MTASNAASSKINGALIESAVLTWAWPPARCAATAIFSTETSDSSTVPAEPTLCAGCQAGSARAGSQIERVTALSNVGRLQHRLRRVREFLINEVCI
jgi:hypothetical protein